MIYALFTLCLAGPATAGVGVFGYVPSNSPAITTNSSVTASAFFGDGSHLTGLPNGETNTFTSSKTFTSDVLGLSSFTANALIVNGRVGILTNAPKAALDVWGPIVVNRSNGSRISTFTMESGNLEIQTDQSGNSTLILETAGNPIQFTTHIGAPFIGQATNAGFQVDSTSFVILQNGNIGIKTASPTSLLHITSGTLTIDGNTTNSLIASGRVGLGSNSPTTKLHISSGNITIDGTGTIPSAFALCLSTGGLMGHCTTAPNAGGACTCSSP